MTASTQIDPAHLPGGGTLSADPLHLARSRAASTTADRDVASVTGRADARPISGSVPYRRARTRVLLLVEEAVGTCAVCLVAAFSAGTTVPTVLVLAFGWLTILGGQLAALTRLDTCNPLPLRVRCGALLGLSCWIASSVWEFPSSAREQLVLIATLTAASATIAQLGARLHRAALPRVVVLGCAESVVRDVPELRRTSTVVSVCVLEPSDRDRLREELSLPVLVGVDQVPPTAVASVADAVIVLPSAALDASTLRRLSSDLEPAGVPLLVGTGLRDVMAHRARLTRAAGLNVVHVLPARRRGASCLVKAVLDRTVAAVALTLLLPLLVFLVVAIRVESPGPAVFRQCRTGRDGRTFTLFKLRTMTADAEARISHLVDQNEVGGPMFKIRRDPRVTRVGRHLRRYSLDELPQLVNVLLGQMSLVGPRPALPSEVTAYQDDPRRRLVVKPGLTGLWQVSGRSDLAWEDAVRLDLQYVDNWSLRLDLAILWRTVGAVLSHRGAY